MLYQHGVPKWKTPKITPEIRKSYTFLRERIELAQSYLHTSRNDFTLKLVLESNWKFKNMEQKKRMNKNNTYRNSLSKFRIKNHVHSFFLLWEERHRKNQFDLNVNENIIISDHQDAKGTKRMKRKNKSVKVHFWLWFIFCRSR